MGCCQLNSLGCSRIVPRAKLLASVIKWKGLSWLGSIRTSVWKSSCKTGKRLRLDQTKTDQDWKFTRLIKTTTMVQSLVHRIFKVFKTSLNQSQPVSTGLSGLKYSCHIGKEQ